MRRWQKVLLIVLLLTSSILAATYWFLQKAISALPVTNLQYQIASVSLHQLQLKQIYFQSIDRNAAVSVDEVTIDWRFANGFLPAVTKIMFNRGSVTLNHWPERDENIDKTSSNNAVMTLPDNWQLPDNIPALIQLRDLHISLPCASTRCDYVVSINTQFHDDKLSADIKLTDSDSLAIPRLQLDAQYNVNQQLPEIVLDIKLENQSQLRLEQKLEQDRHAYGTLDLLLAPPSDWLLLQLQKWQITIPEQALSQFNAPVTLDSQWQFSLPDELTLSALSQHVAGQINFRGHLPAPLTIPNVGQLQGDITAELAIQQGEISKYQLNAELELLQPQLPKKWLHYGINSDKLTMSLSTDGIQKPQLTALPLHIVLQSSGHTAATFSTNATINLTPPLSAALKNSTLTLQQPHLSIKESLSLETIALNSAFDAYWLADSWQLMLKHANLKIASLSQDQNQLNQLDLVLDVGQLSGDSQFSTLKLHNALRIKADKILHPSLKPLSWQWQGKLTGALNTLSVIGKLSNSADLSVTHQLTYQPATLELNWQLQELFLLAGNPLQATFTAWPALLEFNRGRINASGSFNWADSVALQAELNLSGVSGIYDRSIFKDLTAPLSLQYQGDDIAITTTQTKVAEIQHGLTAGPLLLSASYTAKANTPGAGKLNISTLDMQLMGGKVSAEPITLDLAMEQQEVILQLQRIDLAQLLQQHPTTDLSGNGRISGRVPVQISRSGINVDKGLVAAESPGGVLQYRPPAAQSMASGNQGMKVVLDALNDFHYSVLSSDVSYNNDGQLTLALRLQGKNPALEAGRPINLNINLEEDIPALITSLQLSSQISDKIKQRVQQHLQQNGAKRTNGAKP